MMLHRCWMCTKTSGKKQGQYFITCLRKRWQVIWNQWNLGYNFWAKRDGAFIFWYTSYTCKYQYFWFCDLDLPLKNGHKFRSDLKSLGFDITHVFLVIRPFCRCQHFLPHDLNINFLTTFEKQLTFAITLNQERWTFVLHMYFLSLYWCHKFWPSDLDFDFWKTLT